MQFVLEYVWYTHIHLYSSCSVRNAVMGKILCPIDVLLFLMGKYLVG